MKFINSAQTSIRIYTYLNHLRDASWKVTSWIAHGSSLEQHQAKHAVEVQIFADRDGVVSLIGDSRWKVTNFAYHGSVEHKQGPASYENTTRVIITHRDDYRFVDWRAATAPYFAQAKALGAQDSANEAVKDGVDAVMALLSGLATGFSAMGPPGALPAGIGSMILALIGATRTAPPPAPPDAEAIEAIVATVVQRELDIQDAEKAATAFASTAEELLDRSNTIYRRLVNPDGTLSGLDLTEHQREDAENFIHAALELKGEGTLLYSINHMAGHPEMAKWILPTYLHGITAYLAILRMHIVWAGNTQSNGNVTYSVSMGEVVDYRTKVTRQKAALRAALDAFLEHLNAKIAAAHLDGTTMEADFSTLICRSIFAIDDVTAVSAGIDRLGEMEVNLDRILESGDTSTFAP